MKFGLRELVFVALLMAIPIGAWTMVFRPQNERNEQMMQQIETKQAKLRELNQATATIGDLRAEIEALEEAIGFFESKLPSAKEMDKVLQEVWRLAEENKLTTKSIRTKAVDNKSSFVSGTGPHEQPIVMKLEGDFMGFYGFLQAMENQPRIMRISNMDINALPKGPKGHMEADLELSIFFERSGS